MQAPRPPPMPSIIGDAFRVKWVLIYFGYTSCPDACPTALNNMGVALDRVGPEAAALQRVFIPVGRKRDTRSRLRVHRLWRRRD